MAFKGGGGVCLSRAFKRRGRLFEALRYYHCIHDYMITFCTYLIYFLYIWQYLLPDYRSYLQKASIKVISNNNESTSNNSKIITAITRHAGIMERVNILFYKIWERNLQNTLKIFPLSTFVTNTSIRKSK